MVGHIIRAVAATGNHVPSRFFRQYATPSRAMRVIGSSMSCDKYRWASSSHHAHMKLSSWQLLSNGNDVYSVLHDQQIRWYSSRGRNSHVVKQIRWGSSKGGNAHENSQRDNWRGPDMRNCRSIEEIARVAYDQLDSMWHRDISAFWTIVARIMASKSKKSKRHGNPQEEAERLQHLLHQLDSILYRTLNDISTFAPRELVQTAHGIGRTVSKLEKTKHLSGPQQVLHSILVGDEDSQQKEYIFQSIANASTHSLSKFDPRCLSTLANANALAGCVPTFRDGSTLFDYIAKNCINKKKLRKFKPQELANVIWSFEIGGQTNSELFEAVADHIISLDEYDLYEFKPQELSNLLVAYAKFDGDGEDNVTSRTQLFNKVADYIEATQDFEEFVGIQCSVLHCQHCH